MFALYMIIISFFRDPERDISEGIVSPADGRIMEIETRGREVKISIFMSIWDVHVNRAPTDCTVLSKERHPGGYVPAFNKESERNERVEYTLSTHFGRMSLVQIAGALARRIIPYVEAGDRLSAGDRLGLIRFGSRVDLVFRLPSGWSVRVDKGDKTTAGVTVLAERREGG